MKHFVTVLMFCFSLSSAFAQTNYSGVYGYSLKTPSEAPKDEKAAGAYGYLTLIQMEGSKYRFWLDINRGWPSYNEGAADGTITFKNDTASFDNTYETAQQDCRLHFIVKNNSITIKATSHSADCGFGNAVTAGGDYPKLDKQPALDNTWLKEQYNQSPAATVIIDKADIYEDEDCYRSKKQYFVKGDTVLAIAETAKSIYTEYITPAGKFVYGWVKKAAIKISP